MAQPARRQEGIMGILIRFPDDKRAAANLGRAPFAGASASIVILPVIRIERHCEERPAGPASAADGSGGRRRKRPARRS